MAFQTLNRLKWTGRLGEARVVILHRGVPGDRKSISCRSILEIKKGYFIYQEADREVFIPNHRIREVWLEGELLWKRREKAL